MYNSTNAPHSLVQSYVTNAKYSLQQSASLGLTLSYTNEMVTAAPRPFTGEKNSLSPEHHIQLEQ